VLLPCTQALKKGLKNTRFIARETMTEPVEF
jgi:hypothetical protein